jgi:hypothetical protein
MENQEVKEVVVKTKKEKKYDKHDRKVLEMEAKNPKAVLKIARLKKQRDNFVDRVSRGRAY